MPTIGQSAMLASVLVGMLSIPAASQELDVSQSVVGDIDNISASEQDPRDVSESLGSDSYTKVVSDAFSEFRTMISPESSKVSKTTSNSRVTVETEPGEKTFVLETPSGTIERTYSSGSVTETVTTPSGVLTESREKGAVTVEFEGEDRKVVEETAETLRQDLQQEVRNLRKRSNVTSENEDGTQIDVEIEPEGDEYIRISSSTGVDLDGWKVEDSDNQSYTFEDISIEEGESLTLYSGTGDGNQTSIYWGTPYIWNNGGDTATIYNSEGEKVMERSY